MFFVCVCRSFRIHIRADAMFTRENDQGEMMHVPGFFGTLPQDIDGARDLDLAAISSELAAQVEHWNSRGSGFVLERITKFVICITKFRPLHGSSYIATPKYLANKKCIINVENDDQKCFLWAVLSAIHPVEVHAERLSHYRKYENELKVDNLCFPIATKDVPKFEEMNSELSINILAVGDTKHEYCVEYLSPHRNRTHHINLFLIEEGQKRHYVYVKNMSRLVGDRTRHNGQTYVCNSCLHPFCDKTTLEHHVPYCLRHPPQDVKYPDPEDEDEPICKFRGHYKQHRLPFHLICDFESFLSPIENDDDDRGTRPIDEHRVSGFACYRVTDFPEHQTPPTVYSGDNPMEVFYEHVMKESKILGQIISGDEEMIPLTGEQQAEYDNATSCFACAKPFTGKSWKVRHHCHVSGNFLFAACNNCNLQLKTVPGKRKRKNKKDSNPKKFRKMSTKERAKEDYEDSYFIPIIFHNLKSYDAHFVIKHFQKKYTECVDKDDRVTYGDVRVTAINSEKYMTFEIGKLRFLDSFQFLPSSLENLVSVLLKSGKGNFENTCKYLGDNELVFAKGVYPYSYMTSAEKFDETQLPPIEAFYDNLNEEPLETDDYERAQATWRHFGIKNMREYHDHYLLSDILLLSDVFSYFRNSIMTQHRLDCLHYATLPSLAWASALKYTDVKLDLLTNPDAYLMIENSMRGGIATISNRHASANNPHVEGYDETKPTTFITYLDANNLYGGAMSEPLPTGNFHFLSQPEIDAFDLSSIPPDGDIGYIVECDLQYPAHLHDLHNDYPMAADHLVVNRDMLSPFVSSLVDKHWKPTQKLVPNLMNKHKYVCHYRNLQFYVQHGLELTKIHRILAFLQGPWLKPWIDYCTERRTNAASEFEADLAKLQANATFGKTMEQVRHRMNIRLICDPDKLTKAVSKVSFRQSEIINEDLVMVRAARQRVTLNKPISVGFTILELSKLIMYEFYYDYLKVKYGDKCKLLFTDTDSLCCHIETADIYADMRENLTFFDTSNFEPQHPLYSMQNHRVLGKFKSETGSAAPSEFVGLRAKVYSLDVPKRRKQSKIRVKGIKKSYVKKHVRHEQFLKVLHAQKPTMSKFRNFRSKNHHLETVEISKTCLNAFDDKRFILEDGISTLAYGHHAIADLYL